MVASIETGDLPRIAREAGQSGKPEPVWAKDKPELHAAYQAGAGLPDDTTPEPPATPPQTPPQRQAARGRRAPAPRPAEAETGRSGSRKSSSGKGKPSRFARTVDRVTGVGGGTGGGLLLAVFAYPIGMAILKSGPSGATDWLKAKFLNKVPAVPATGQSTDPSKPYYVDPKAKPGQPGSGKWPNGVPIPGQPQPAPNIPGSTQE